ncbi:hypothetical protein HMPREF0297_0642, partial [Corynebacterium jeikeium ATCC 43734]
MRICLRSDGSNTRCHPAGAYRKRSIFFALPSNKFLMVDSRS